MSIKLTNRQLRDLPEPTQTQLRAGVRKPSNLCLTQRGRRYLLNILADEFEDDLTERSEKRLEYEKSKKKKSRRRGRRS